MVYWDTSALLKLYVAEHDSAQFAALLASSSEDVGSSELATIEMLCALEQKERSGGVKPGSAGVLFGRFQNDLAAGRLVGVPFGPDVVAQVERVLRRTRRKRPPVLVRSLDAIHIGSALAAGARKMVATDKRLRDVAGLMGMRLLPD